MTASLRRLLVVAAATLLAGCSGAAPGGSPAGGASGSSPAVTGDPVRIGAVFPISGTAASLALEELRGVQLAADFVNADGGIDGRRVVLDIRDLESGDAAPAAMASLRSDGASVVIGAYSSELSIPAAAAADKAGLVYWEAGAVADQLTGQGLPLVFRVGASSTNLGDNSADFAATQLAPRLGTTAAGVRLAIVAANDAYPQSVAAAAASTARANGSQIVDQQTYNLTYPDWPRVMAELAAAKPSVIILASHIDDGVAFRKAMVAAGLKVAALIGSTMAECTPDFAGELGADAIGVFASDRPTGGFQPSALDPDARAIYDRLAAAWSTDNPTTAPADEYGTGPDPAASPGSGPVIVGPIDETSPAAGPSEEALSGFSAAWALFRDVLPAAAHDGLSAERIAAAARSLDLPAGSLPNGAGIKFSSAAASLGQNLRAAAVIWQWQAVQQYTFVWPPTYATGSIQFVPLDK
ncbi:MAG TPA: ABC transporter substrate-binding protein [Candidatus Limnocylindrales bacterium]|jgi:branched-chain amino acid transport system substrate-binding protein